MTPVRQARNSAGELHAHPGNGTGNSTLPPSAWRALEESQLSGTRVAYFLALSTGALLVCLLEVLELWDWVAPLGHDALWVALGVGGLLATAYASLFSPWFAARVVAVSAYLPLLGFLLSTPTPDYPASSERVGLFVIFTLVALTLTVRLEAALAITVVSGLWLVWFLAEHDLPAPLLTGVQWGLAIAFGLVLRHFRMRVAKESLIRRIDLQKRVRTDPLTGLHNRNGWNELAPQLFEDAITGRRPVLALFFDVDRFKRVNDDFGHEVGDEILRTLAGILSRLRPARSVAARLGGEEFVVLLAGPAPAEAHEFAEQVRAQFAEQTTDRGITVSAGIALRTADEALAPLMRRADQALYRAKELGRNRVEWAMEPEAPLAQPRP